MDPRNPPPGTQVILAGDAETIAIDDTGETPEPIEAAPGGPADPDSTDPFDDAFAGDVDPDTVPEAGATEEVGGEGSDQTAPTPPTAPAETERPGWLPAEIDHAGLTDAELLRLRVVHQSAQADNQLDPQEAALVHRYREARSERDSPSVPPATPQVAPYQPQLLDVPEGYESDVAIRGLVENINRQNAENAHLVNTQAQQMAALGQAVHTTSQQAVESGRVAAWQAFLAEHPEARDAEVQQKIADQIAFWTDQNRQPGQFWAAALQNVLPESKPKAEKPVASVPMDPATKQARARRAMAASAVHPASQTLEPGERTAALDQLHENNADFGEFLRAEFPNG